MSCFIRCHAVLDLGALERKMHKLQTLTHDPCCEITQLDSTVWNQEMRWLPLRGLKMALLPHSLFCGALRPLLHIPSSLLFYFGRRIHQSTRSLLFHPHQLSCSVWLKEERGGKQHVTGISELLWNLPSIGFGHVSYPKPHFPYL